MHGNDSGYFTHSKYSSFTEGVNALNSLFIFALIEACIGGGAHIPTTVPA